MTKQFNIKEMPQQYAALCYRIKKGRVKILLITSRDTGRWVLPKGWPVKKLGGVGSAACEAWEEAGVVGKASRKSIGSYRYEKMIDRKSSVECLVEVYPMEVSKLEDSYPEKKERLRRWFSIAGAAKRVDEQELRDIILGFDPD